MPTQLPAISKCPCGKSPIAKSRQSQEDVVDNWVECSCGRFGGEWESSMGDKASSIAQWNYEVKHGMISDPEAKNDEPKI